MKMSRTTVTVSMERAEFWEKKNLSANENTLCTGGPGTVLCSSESISGEQAWCHPAHHLPSVSRLEKPTSSPSCSESAGCWKSSCDKQPQRTSEHRHCSCHVIHQQVPVAKLRHPPHGTLCLTCIPWRGGMQETTCHELKGWMGTK